MSELSPSGGSERYGAGDDEVNAGDNGEVSDVFLFGHKCVYLRRQVHARSGRKPAVNVVSVRNRALYAACSAACW